MLARRTPVHTAPSSEHPERPPQLPSIAPPTDTTAADNYKPPEEPKMYLEKSAFVPAKPLPHSPKISPSSIPNPNPSVSTNKQIESGYPNYGGYLYSVPGYSAFQPVSYPNIIPPNQPLPIVSKNSDFTPYPLISKESQEVKSKEQQVAASAPTQAEKPDPIKPQTDFEEHFKPEIIPASSLPGDSNIQISESKMSITSLAQGSGATITVPSQIHHNTENKKKPIERFSLKTSIPISKIDMKCVNNTPDSAQKKLPVPFHPAFQSTKTDNPKIEIQSNVVIKSGTKETNESPDTKHKDVGQINNISTLLNAAEAISKSDSQFRKPEPKPEAPKEIKDPPPFPNTPPNPQPRPIFNPLNIETKKTNFTNTTDATHGEQNNSILFIQNKTPSNPKMLLAIQQQSPQVLLQRTNFESKNLLAPSRLSSQLKKSKDDSDSLSKVVALKRLHQENCDENDFENLITENQIYGNKIVVKEKSQGTLQEQDLKNKNKLTDKIQTDSKNVVLQPNFVYLSNLQFPANLMMLKNNTKNTQSNDATKVNKIIGKEIKVTTSEAGTMTNSNGLNLNNNSKNTGKEITLFNSNNNVLQTISNKNNTSDMVFQSNPKVIMNPQIVYQMPMIVDTENKINQPFNKDYPNMTGSKTDYTKPFDASKQNDKLFIACPYQIDSKLQPKLVITNIRPKITKIDETSSLDLYEKKKRLRRLKHLTNRDNKNTSKPEIKKGQSTIDNANNIITPDKMKGEIYREFAETRMIVNDGSSSSDSEYGDEELIEYDEIIKQYGTANDNDEGKEEFLANLNLGTHSLRKDKEMELQENSLRKDSVASAYVAAGRLDRLCNEGNKDSVNVAQTVNVKVMQNKTRESPIMLKKKQQFLSRMSLVQVNSQYKKGFEQTWKEIIKERNRRNIAIDSNFILKAPKYVPMSNFSTNTQLQILTEIKRCVNENNNLIKKRLDSACEDENLGDSIKVLAEKNFTELDRLSKMADRCVKLFSGQETKKRDLNPGFDSENIQKLPAIEQQINIPDISKIISLKSCVETSVVTSSQATSMDEPRSSAAGVSEMFTENEKSREVGCQSDPSFTWTDLEHFMAYYKVHDNARNKEISELQRRTTALRVECAHVTLSASRNSDRARALLAEQQHLAEEERVVRASVARLTSAIHAIKNY